jgi:RNA polymerase sigma factor (sigma-70 family)
MVKNTEKLLLMYNNRHIWVTFFEPKESVVDKEWMLSHDDIKLLRKDTYHREIFTRKLFNDVIINTGIKNLVRKYTIDLGMFDDLFQNTIILFLKSIVFKSDVQQIKDVRAYIYVIARNRLYTELKSKSPQIQFDDVDRASFSDGYTGESLVLDIERRGELLRIIALVGEKCKQVLMYWSAGYSMDEIADMMEYKSSGMAKKKKYECLNSLLTLLENKPAIKKALYNLR